MPTVFSPAQWFKTAEEVYTIVHAELLTAHKPISEDELKDLQTMYDFFRFLRGDRALALRPGGIGEFSSQLYEMEKELNSLLAGLT